MIPYLPKIGGLKDVSMELQFTASAFDALSFRTTPIEIVDYSEPQRVISHATGFFWESDGNQFLITNRHVVTGKNTFTGECLDKSLFRPYRIRYYEIVWHHHPAGQALCERKMVEIDLFDNEKAIFLQDPEFHKYKVDIVAIPLSRKMKIQESKFSPFVNHFRFEPLFHSVGNTVFVVGYPFRNYEGTMIPIWKSGTLAAEPFFPIDNKPMFLLDTLTKEGMSGSPVFRRVFGPAAGPDQVINPNSIVRTEFVGVYSGRMASQEFAQAGLGIAWYANRIPKIIAGKNFPFYDSIHEMAAE